MLMKSNVKKSGTLSGLVMWLLLHSFVQLRTKANAKDSNLYPTAQIEPKKVKNTKTFFSKLLLWLMSMPRPIIGNDLWKALENFPQIQLEAGMGALFRNYCFNKVYHDNIIKKIWTFKSIWKDAIETEMDKSYFTMVFNLSKTALYIEL